jgi:hypothetical protein
VLIALWLTVSKVHMGFVSKRLVSLRSWGSLGVSEVKGLLARAASRSRARDAESSGLAGMRAFGLKTPMARELGVQKVFGLDVSRALLLAASKVLFGALVTESSPSSRCFGLRTEGAKGFGWKG